MKSILIYVLHIVVLICIMDVFIMSTIITHDIGFFRVAEQVKPLALMDMITCGILFLFAKESNRCSIKNIILICTSCWILTAILSSAVAYLVIGYSNIPESVILYQQMGKDLAWGNVVSSFIASVFTAVILIVRAKKRKG